MTEEQIKNLKDGDKFTVEYTVKAIFQESLYYAYSDSVGEATYTGDFLKCATLVNPAPAFEVGDTVRIIPDPLTGTVHNSFGKQDRFNGLIVKLTELNTNAAQAIFHRDGLVHEVSIHCLALVAKAVKDKYKVQGAPFNWEVVAGTDIVASYDRCNHPNAEAAARAECDRLNAEWRKEQEGKEGADHE